MREALSRSGQGEPYFRWRGKDVTRVENFSDIVFALTLSLIVASSVPTTFDDLIGLWREVLAIGACFAILYMIWRAHYIYFRRYDLEDGRTLMLNIVLLFLVMVFAYPLKFLSLFLVDLQTYFVLRPPGAPEFASRLSYQQAPYLSAIYATGYLLVFLVFNRLYSHAASLSDDIGLNSPERIMTALAVVQTRIHVGVAFLVVILSLSLPMKYAVWSGMLFFLLGPLLALSGMRYGRRAKASEQE